MNTPNECRSGQNAFTLVASMPFTHPMPVAFCHSANTTFVAAPASTTPTKRLSSRSPP